MFKTGPGISAMHYDFFTFKVVKVKKFTFIFSGFKTKCQEGMHGYPTKRCVK
jgi:hypothetical protein